jgi:endoglucanase
LKNLKAIYAYCIFCLLPFLGGAQSAIQLNQLGFYPNAAKIAVLTAPSNAHIFYVLSQNLKDTFFIGTTGSEKQSAYSSTKTSILDFSGLKKTGNYVIKIGTVQSYPFTISNDANKVAAIASLKGFYFQRSSIPLEEKFAGQWKRTGFHPDNKVQVHASAASKERPEGFVISSVGGWYDAGDYNKYIVNSGISNATLFSAYEDFPTYFEKLKTQIPESNNGIPDLLNEAIYNLRWMLTMQDPNDGGVYHKCTNAVFDGMVMPGVTKEIRYVVQKSTAASLDFAAVTAQASRILKGFEKHFPGLADSCLQASKKAWNWSLVNPNKLYEQDKMNQTFKPAVITGAYGDNNVTDEWIWASAELYVSTKEKEYATGFEKYNTNYKATLPNWNNVGLLGYYSLLHVSDAIPAFSATAIDQLKSTVINIANQYISKVSENAFQTVMGQSARDFNWGSNSNAANQGILLVKAYLISGDQKYINYALTNVDYILGRNATGYCFVTGLGSKPSMNPHHRQSISDGIEAPVPGLLVGGPNPGMQDKCVYQFKEPETAYTDQSCSYASNEIAINWNAPLVYLANAIEALKYKVGFVLK